MFEKVREDFEVDQMKGNLETNLDGFEKCGCVQCGGMLHFPFCQDTVVKIILLLKLLEFPLA